MRAGGLSVDVEEIEARIVIGADGCNGATAKALGLGREIVHGVALEANVPRDARYSGVKVAIDRFPRTTFALARLPLTFSTVERLLQGELGHPGAARGTERQAIRLISAVARVAGDPGRTFEPVLG